MVYIDEYRDAIRRGNRFGTDDDFRGDSDETEDFVETEFDPLGMIINAVGGALGGGKPSGEGAGGGAAGGLGGMASGLVGGLMGGGKNPVSGLVSGLGQGIDQTTVGIPAQNPLGSILGAGMGGLFGGTGPLPDPLGLFARKNFGAPFLPAPHLLDPMGLFNSQGGFNQAHPWTQLASHSEKIGRAIIKRLLGITEPELKEIKELLRHRAAQIQATGEHRTLQNQQDFKTRVIELLLGIQGRLPAAAAVSPKPLLNLPAALKPTVVPRTAPVIYAQKVSLTGARRY